MTVWTPLKVRLALFVILYFYFNCAQTRSCPACKVHHHSPQFHAKAYVQSLLHKAAKVTAKLIIWSIFGRESGRVVSESNALLLASVAIVT